MPFFIRGSHLPPAIIAALICLAPTARSADPAPAPVRVDEAPPLLREWIQPAYPESARQAKAEGRVLVSFVVEADGKVTRVSLERSSDPQFNDAALAAVPRWVFDPALSDGKPTATALRVLVVFKLEQLAQKSPPLWPSQDQLPVPLPRVPPKMKAAPNPEYPAELEEQKLSGRVEFEFIVGIDGKAHQPRVLLATHPAFVTAALSALARCEFEPAHQGPLLLAATQQAPMEFTSLGVDRSALLAVNHIEPVTPEGFQSAPQPHVLCAPVYPRDKLLAGETGAAVVEFTVNERGGTENVRVTSATQPEFGAALRAAVETWIFSPAVNEGKSVPAGLRATQDFAPPASGPIARLLPALQPGGAGIGGARGLDRQLAPLWRGFPVYPESLRTEKPTGEAMIEFVIDREGRARLPRVVSATHEAFGWAAAAAINQWVFEPPVRGGQPVDVRVSIPVNFAPPKE